MFPKSPPPPLRTLDGFELLERLGSGGAGEVFLAKSRGGRDVAIKVLGEQVTQDPELREALAREAMLSSRLEHPAIVRLRAFVDKDDVTALVFEYVPGVALARLLRHADRRGERLPDRAGGHVLERVLAALAFAHAYVDDADRKSPIVHRDVSPSNVLVDWHGAVKLTDFGLAKVLGAGESTRVGLVKGTLGCMAPEQARGDTVNERADVYAAALLGWRVLTGRSPFAKYENDDAEMLRAMKNPRLSPLAVMRPDLHPALHAAFAAALEPNAALRTITADELGARVREHLDVEHGAVELARLLARWRGALERGAGRSEPAGSAERKDSGPTVRYEESALARASDDGSRARPSAAGDDDGLDFDDVPTAAFSRGKVQPSTPALPPAELDERAPSPAPVPDAHDVRVPPPALLPVELRLPVVQPPSRFPPLARLAAVSAITIVLAIVVMWVLR